MGGLRPHPRPGRQQPAGRDRPRARDQPGLDHAGPARRTRAGGPRARPRHRLRGAVAAPGRATPQRSSRPTSTRGRSRWRGSRRRCRLQVAYRRARRRACTSRWRGSGSTWCVTNPPFVVSPADGRAAGLPRLRAAGRRGGAADRHRRAGGAGRGRLVPGARQLGARRRAAVGAAGRGVGGRHGLRCVGAAARASSTPPTYVELWLADAGLAGTPEWARGATTPGWRGSTRQRHRGCRARLAVACGAPAGPSRWCGSRTGRTTSSSRSAPHVAVVGTADRRAGGVSATTALLGCAAGAGRRRRAGDVRRAGRRGPEADRAAPQPGRAPGPPGRHRRGGPGGGVRRRADARPGARRAGVAARPRRRRPAVRRRSPPCATCWPRAGSPPDPRVLVARSEGSGCAVRGFWLRGPRVLVVGSGLEPGPHQPADAAELCGLDHGGDVGGRVVAGVRRAAEAGGGDADELVGVVVAAGVVRARTVAMPSRRAVAIRSSRTPQRPEPPVQTGTTPPSPTPTRSSATMARNVRRSAGGSPSACSREPKWCIASPSPSGSSAPKATNTVGSAVGRPGCRAAPARAAPRRRSVVLGAGCDRDVSRCDADQSPRPAGIEVGRHRDTFRDVPLHRHAPGVAGRHRGSVGCCV